MVSELLSLRGGRDVDSLWGDRVRMYGQEAGQNRGWKQEIFALLQCKLRRVRTSP
jgi:hypothetical protein